MKFLLMNKNTKVALVEYNNKTKEIKKIYEIYNLDYAPMQLINSENNKAISSVKALNNWYRNRGIPKWRKDINEILNNLNIEDTNDLLDKAYALSLSDQYWIKEESDPVKWEDINFFENDFKYKGYLDITFSLGNSEEELSLVSPNNTTDGMVKKAWMIENDKRVLVKGSYSSAFQEEPINEWLVSQICSRLGLDFCNYSIDVINNMLVSKCEDFINSDEEIITAYNIYKSKNKSNNVNDYEHYINILEEHSIFNAREKLEDMFFIDYLVMNYDRHMNNFGVIKNVNTLKWERLTPIFDTGEAMNCNKNAIMMNFYDGTGKFFSNTNKLFSTYLDFIDIRRYDLKSLDDIPKMYNDILKKYQYITDISDERINSLVKGLKMRIENLKKI